MQILVMAHNLRVVNRGAGYDFCSAVRGLPGLNSIVIFQAGEMKNART